MSTAPEAARPLVIVGAGGHAVSVANVAASAGFAVRCFVDPGKTGQTLLGVDIVAGVAALGDPGRYCFALGIGDNAIRMKVFDEIAGAFGALAFPPLIHGSAVVSGFCAVGMGTVIMPLAVIGPNSTVERFCLVNTRASIDHDCVMQEFSSLAPGAVTGGRVEIGRRSAVSIGATVKDGIRIGSDVVVGASSYVNRHLPDRTVAYGTPARVIRTREPGEPYLMR